MSKYIDADKLIDKIERFSATEYGGNTLGDDVANGALNYVLEEIIPSLQQEQPEPVKGKFVFPKLLYARTLDNKTIDVSYGPQDMTAIEYVRNDFVGQPEVDLGKVLSGFTRRYAYENSGEYPSAIDIARHFYKLGLNARKEE